MMVLMFLGAIQESVCPRIGVPQLQRKTPSIRALLSLLVGKNALQFSREHRLITIRSNLLILHLDSKHIRREILVE